MRQVTAISGSLLEHVRMPAILPVRQGLQDCRRWQAELLLEHRFFHRVPDGLSRMAGSLGRLEKTVTGCVRGGKGVKEAAEARCCVWRGGAGARYTGATPPAAYPQAQAEQDAAHRLEA